MYVVAACVGLSGLAWTYLRWRWFVQNAAWVRALRRSWRSFRRQTNIRGGNLCRPLRPQRESKVEASSAPAVLWGLVRIRSRGLLDLDKWRYEAQESCNADPQSSLDQGVPCK